MLERCSKTFTVFHWCSDTRRSECYMEVTFDTRGNPKCSHMSNKQLRHGACCCSVGKAWGPKCELCPQRGSPEYAALCPDRNGFTPNNITVSLSLLKKTKLRIHQNFCVQLSVDRTRFAPSSERKYATISNFVSFFYVLVLRTMRAAFLSWKDEWKFRGTIKNLKFEFIFYSYLMVSGSSRGYRRMQRPSRAM